MTDKLKIAFILPSLSNQAPVKVTLSIIEGLINSNFDVTVYYFKKVSNPVHFPCETINFSFFKKIPFDEYSIINSVQFRSDLYILLHKPKFSSCKFISTVHQDIFKNLNYTYGFLISKLFTPVWLLSLKSFDEVIVLSDVMANIYKSHLNVIKRIYNGLTLDPNKYLRNLDTKTSPHYNLLAVGGLTDTKGFDQIIKALNLLPNCTLTIAGCGKRYSYLKNLVLKFDLSDRIFFLGHVDNVQELMSKSDLVVIPSRSEGFPLVLLEAVAMQVPVITSDLPIFKEIFLDSEVTKFNLENIEDLAQKITYILYECPSLCSYERYLNHYTESAMQKNYLNYYQGLLK